MLTDFFGFLARIGDKYHFLKNNAFYRACVPYLNWVISFITRGPLPRPDANAVSFFAQHAARVKAVATMLADDRSREVYLGLIAFRQSYSKKDFPPSDWKTPSYFVKEIDLGNDEVFLDCGAYIGDTMDVFIRRCPGYKHIVAFEPYPPNFNKLQKWYGDNPKITLFKAGVYDHDGVVQFAEHGPFGSKVSDAQDDAASISVKTIDGLNLSRVTFVKMDIEGAELNALKGAEQTILRGKPKLAICIYHSNDDMIRIAEYIHALVPEYKLYVHHHSWYPSPNETVLYAVMPKHECHNEKNGNAVN